MDLEGKKILKEVRTYFGVYYVLKDEETGEVTQEWEDGVVNLLAQDVNKFTFQTVANAFLNVVDGTEEAKSEESEQLWEISRNVFDKIINKIENKDNIDKAKKYISNQLNSLDIELLKPLEIIPAKIRELLEETVKENEDVYGEAKQELENSPEFIFDRQILEYKIHRVYCRNAEDEWFDGDDKMITSGVHGEADGEGKLLFQALSEFELGTFKEKETKTYSPPISLATMDIKRNLDFPKYFQLNLALAERDTGGFAEYIKELLEGFKTWFEKYIVPIITTTVTGAIAGGATGSVVPALGTAVGALVGTLAGIVVGSIIEIVKVLLSDEIFGNRITYEIIQQFLSNDGKKLVPRLSNGSTFSGLHTATFNEHNASYDVVYSWELK